jgi:hypothetical protein
MVSMDIEVLAKALFEARPHAHPQGRIPNWDIQPEDIKNVFRDAGVSIRELATIADKYGYIVQKRQPY